MSWDAVKQIDSRWYWVFSYRSTCANLDPVFGTEGDSDFKADALDRSLVSDTWVNEIRWHNGVPEPKDSTNYEKLILHSVKHCCVKGCTYNHEEKKVPEDSLQIISWG